MHHRLRDRQPAFVSSDMSDNFLMKVQNLAQLEVVSMLGREVDDGPHDLEIDVPPMDNMVCLLAYPCQVVDVVDAPKGVIYLLQEFCR